MRKRTFKEVIEEHDRQIAWQKAVIREEAREAAKNEVKKDK